MAAHRGGLVGRVDRTVSLVGGHLVQGPSSSDPDGAGHRRRRSTRRVGRVGRLGRIGGTPVIVGRGPVARVLRIAAPDGPRFYLSTVLGVAAALCTVGLLACSGALIDKAALRPPLYTLTVLMAAVQLLALGRGPLRYAERLVSHDAALGALGRVAPVALRRDRAAVAGRGGRLARRRPAGPGHGRRRPPAGRLPPGGRPAARGRGHRRDHRGRGGPGAAGRRPGARYLPDRWLRGRLHPGLVPATAPRRRGGRPARRARSRRGRTPPGRAGPRGHGP